MLTVTRYSCPLCTWQLDVEGPSVEAWPVVLDVYSILREHLQGTEGELRSHLETHKLEEWVAKVNRLQNELAALREN